MLEMDSLYLRLLQLPMGIAFVILDPIMILSQSNMVMTCSVILLIAAVISIAMIFITALLKRMAASTKLSS